MTQDLAPAASPPEAPPAGVAPAIHARRWTILAVLCSSLLVVMLANSNLNMALPAMSGALSLSSLQLTWIVDVYSLLFAGVLFTSGAVGDRYGRKLTMQLGLALFLLASLYSGFLASTGEELIAARAVMGIGGAMVMPTTLSIINTIFAEHERPRAIAVWTGVAGLGVAIGSIVSGFLLEHFSWESTFVFSAAIGVLGFLANQVLVPESRDEKRTPVDWLGGALSTAGLVGVVYAIIEGPSQGLGDSGVLTGLIAGAVALVLFVLWELRTDHPMLDMALFRRPSFGIASLAVTLTFFALMGVFFVMSQMFQLVMGYGALETSLKILPVMLPMLLFAPLVPSVVAKIGTRWTVAGGLALVSAGFFAMTQWPTVPTYWEVAGGMAIMVAGMAFATTPATNMLMSAVPRNRSGMGSAMNDTTRELGGSLGIAVLGALMSSGYAANLADTTEALPQPLGDAASSSLAGALVVARMLGPQGAHLVEAAKAAWMDGLSSAMVVAGITCAVAALIAARWLPDRLHSTEDAAS